MRWPTGLHITRTEDFSIAIAEHVYALTRTLASGGDANDGNQNCSPNGTLRGRWRWPPVSYSIAPNMMAIPDAMNA